MATLEDTFRKVPPQSLEAEESVLGGILLDTDSLDRVIEVMGVDDFYRESHRKIFRAMLSLSEKNEPIDLITLTDTLRGRGELPDVGGATYLAELVDRVPSAANIANYARIVREKAVMRSLITVSNEIAGRCYDGQEDIEQFLDEAERLIFDVSEKRIRQAFYKIGDMIMDTIKTVEQLHERKELVTGVPTGFLDLDRMTAGFQPSDLLIIAARPSMGKCVKHDTEVLDAETGAIRTIEEICQDQNARLLTLDSQLKLQTTAPSHYLYDGIKPVYRVKTALGREVETTLSHPFLTLEGWRPLAELEVGARIAVPRSTPVFGTTELPDSSVKILGYLLGDGDITGTCARFTNGNARIMEDFLESLASFGGLRGSIDDNSVSVQEDTLTAWLRELELMGKGAAEKYIPPIVFTLTQKKLALFLNRLFSCDGSVFVYRTGQTGISYASVSEKLAKQVQHLLLRFGILSKMRAKQASLADVVHHVYEVEILGSQDILTFIKEIGIFGKEEKIEQVEAIVEQRGKGWTKDTLPLEVWALINAARAGKSWGEVNRLSGRPASHNVHSWRRQPRRETVQLFAQVLGSQMLMALATSDVYWDTITSIEYIGDHRVYDLTIPDTHNFVANDVFVHNTAFVLNIAQYVALHADIAVAVFSLEMSKEQLVLRMLCSEARVDSSKIRTGFLGERDFPRLAMAAGRLAEAPIYIDDTPAQNVLEMRAKSRRLKREADIGLIIIDYLQLMRGLKSQENRTQELSEISRSLKALAKELNVPVIALSQLNRQVEQRADKKPVMSDIRESGSIEQDADVIMFIYRDEVYRPDSPDEGVAEIIVSKQRNGPTGTVRLAFRREYTRFDNLVQDMDAGGEAEEEG